MVEKIKVTFLGTGSAVPTARRNHPATYLQYKDENLLFDCGEGTQRQFRKAKLNPCKITRIFITHWHGDHVLGLPGLLQTLNMSDYKGKLIIYGPRGSKVEFKNMISSTLGFYWNISKMRGDSFNIVVNEVGSGTVFENEEFKIEASEMEHNCPTLAYSFEIKEKNRLDKDKLAKLNIPNSPLMAELAKGETVKIGGKTVDGKKLMYKEPARKVTIIMDTRFNDNAIELAKNSDVVITESTYSKDEQEVAREYSHMTSHDAATIAKKSKSKALVLIHMSQRYSAIPKKILGEAKEIFNDVIVPEDLDGLEL